MSKKCAIILAAGKGTRMKSEKPKVLAEILFKPMLGYVVDSCIQSGVKDICVVCGYKASMVEEYLQKLSEKFKDINITTALQEEQNGTGHAVMMAQSFIDQNINADIAIMTGDAPLLDAQTLISAYDQHKQQDNAITLITAEIENPHGYGRIVRDGDALKKIVEQKDCDEVQVNIKEINSGAYWFKASDLSYGLSKLNTNNSQGEYYLTDTIQITNEQNKKIGGYIAQNSDVILGANSRKDLFELNEKLRKAVIEKHMDNGVNFVSIDGVVISADAKIGADTDIYAGTTIKENVVIGNDCKIGPNTVIENSTIANNVKLNATQCYQSQIDSFADIGPFVHIRPNSHIKEYVHIGDFVEVKNSTIGEGTGISHLTYIGDSDVGKNINFGCGVVTVNYDGVNKNRCVIEDEAFIGCNTNLIAPVNVGKGAYIAAGSTITADVPSQALAIARARQSIKQDYAKNKLDGRKLKFNK